MAPLETAVWWTEYILRADSKQLELMKPLSMNQSWFQRKLIDVWLFLMFCMFTLACCLFYLFKLCFRIWIEVISLTRQNEVRFKVE
jgi:hypothetical protein